MHNTTRTKTPDRRSETRLLEHQVINALASRHLPFGMVMTSDNFHMLRDELLAAWNSENPPQTMADVVTAFRESRFRAVREFGELCTAEENESIALSEWTESTRRTAMETVVETARKGTEGIEIGIRTLLPCIVRSHLGYLFGWLLVLGLPAVAVLFRPAAEQVSGFHAFGADLMAKAMIYSQASLFKITYFGAICWTIGSFIYRVTTGNVWRR